ncbi:hypothetical protein D1224_02965 [Henriciella barbarensis]|uniref:NACHT C-terminal Alpha/Beta 2 domain-containing protein n=1 Tax=Henriciella barbarensis TaxID=86342 RepID=A0A399QW00_9PROT|nr:hypothetical protein [Henriciella barbarensis]RIJ23256.1 hypothetical protein D1224_02965 [Henriciella barbarensis]
MKGAGLALAELLISGGGGWAIGKAADALSAPLEGLAEDINVRFAISAALERSAARLDEVFGEREQADLTDMLRGQHALVFTLILERLKRAPASDLMRGGLSAELAQVLRAGNGQARDALRKLADLIDSELWAKPPLAAYRQKLSEYVNEQRLGHLLERLAPDMSAAAIAARVRFAARSDITRRLSRVHTTRLVLPRRVSELNDEDSAPGPLTALAERLTPGWRGALIDQGGAGKTIALLTIGEAVFSRFDEAAAVYVPMAEAATHGSVISALLQRDALIAENISQADLAAQARAGRLTFLLDGWNELSVDERRQARSAIEAFHGEYPDAPLLFATRPYWSTLPTTISASFALDRITFDDQARFIESVGGVAGLQAHTRTRDHRPLRELLGIPFFLNLFARLEWQASDGDLPENSVQLVSRFVEGEFGRPAYLDPPPGGSAEFVRGLLMELAVRMAGSGTVELHIKAASAVIAARLKAAGHVHNAAECERALQRLSQQSLIQVAGEGRARRFVFDHQLLQDWFASFHVRDAIVACANDTALPSPAAAEFGNARSWEGAVEIAVEALGQSGPIDPGLRRFLMELWGMDPEFAAKMMSRLSDAAWDGIRDDVQRFVRAWRRKDPGVEVLSFMVGTGRSEFAETIFEDLASEKERRRERQLTRRGGFHPDVLGPDWSAKAEGLSRSQRRILVHDLAYSGGDRGLDMAIELSAGDTETDHLGFVLDEIHYLGRKDKSTALFAAMTEASADKWALDERYREIAAEHDPERYRATLKRIIKKGPNTTGGVHARMILCELDGELFPADLIEAGLALHDQSKDNRHWHLHRFSEDAPSALSDVLLEHMKTGKVLYRLHEYVTKVNPAQADDILSFLLDDRRERHDGLGMATHLKPGQLRCVLTEALQICRTLEGADRYAMRDERSRLARLMDVLKNSDNTRLIQILINSPAKNRSEVVLLMKLVTGWKGADHHDERGLSPTGLASLGLHSAIDRWCRLLLAVPDKSSDDLQLALRALAVPGRVSALKRMHEVHEAELLQYEQEHADNPSRLRLRGGYPGDYRRREPFMRHGWPEAKALLLGYIGDERFELGAAIALRKFAPFVAADVQGKGLFPNDRSHELKRERRAVCLERGPSASCHHIAARILDRVAEIDLDAKDGWARARSLAASAAWMDCGPRLAEVIDLIRRDPEPVKSLAILEALAETGQPLKADWILPGLAAAEAEYFAQTWRSENDFYILRPWLDLLARSDTPLELIARKAKHPREVHQWQAGDFISLLMLEDADAMVDAIEALHAECRLGHGDYDRIRALFRVGSDRALSLLLDDVLEGRYQDLLHFGFHGPNAIADMLEREPDKLKAAVAKAASNDNARGNAAYRLGSLCRGAQTAKLFEIALEESRSGSEAMIWRVLAEHMLEGQCTRYEPLGPGSYKLHQKSVGELRQSLFSWVLAEPEEPFWRKLLAGVDDLVSQHGGHPDDPRHPDVVTGVPYPDFEPDIWAKVRILENPPSHFD